MLSIGNDVLRVQDYQVRHLYSGLDELHFDISIYDDQYSLIAEEVQIVDRAGQTYAVKAIDGGNETAKVKAQLDLDELKAELFVGYTNGSATAAATVSGVLPEGWTVDDQSGIQIKRTIDAPGATALEIIDLCRNTYKVAFRFDTKEKTVMIFSQVPPAPIGAFVTRDLNLQELNYKGKSTDFVTRLYAYGKDGLSFASINGGKSYVENHTYSQKVISAYWSDERYTVAENLLADAQAKVDAMAVPSRSYTCTVEDLAKTNPGTYNFQTFKMLASVTLIDDVRKTAVPHQIVEYWEYPYYPEKNTVTLATSTPKIQSQVVQISQAIGNANSAYNQQLSAQINASTGLILNGNGGYVVLDTNADGRIYQILIMDTPSKATAMNVWRWNLGGLGYSSNGANGPFTTAITQDGSIVADFITAGVLNASIIKAGVLQSVDGSFKMNLATGEITLTNASGTTVLAFDANGNLTINGKLTAASGTFNQLASTGSNPSIKFGSNVAIDETSIVVGTIQIENDSITFNQLVTVDENGMWIRGGPEESRFFMENPPTATGGTEARWVFRDDFGAYSLGRYTSARSAKKHITTIKPAEAWAAVGKLNPVRFRFRGQPNSAQRSMGFIADEMAAVCPELATYEAGEPAGVQYSNATALLTAALQEAERRIERLETEMKEMKN